MKQEVVPDAGLINYATEDLKQKYLDEHFILNILPTAVYICNAYGSIINYNQKAVELWGRAPELGVEEALFCGSLKLYYPDGSCMPHHETPGVATLVDGLARKDVELIMEKPDASRIWVKINVVPIKDEHGDVIGVVNCLDDITDQRKVQKELDRKTKELQDYVENAAIGLHWVDANGIIIWANKAELDMLGYSEEEYIGHHISEFHAEQDKINDILNRLSCNETLNEYEAVLRCKDGSTRIVHINSNVFWDEGKFVHTRCFTIDVTEQKKLLQALKQSEAHYRQLIKGLQAAVYTTDAEGHITMYNQAAVNLWGREPEIGKELWCGSYKIYKSDGTEMPLDTCPMAIALKEGRPVFGVEFVILRPDGTLKHVAAHPQPIFDEAGEVLGALNMLVDITEAKQSQLLLRDNEKKLMHLATSLEKKVEERTEDLKKKNEELKKSEERYHKMIDEVEDYAIILMDVNGIIQNWNKGAEKIKGYKEEEIVGKSFEIFYLKEDQEKGLPGKLIKEAKVKGKAIHEGWRVRKDRTRFWGSIVITALHDEQNNIIGFSKVTRDLTERKTAEDKMKEYSTQLEFQNKELEQFAYAASHDMKEPLRKIHFYNSYIADNAANTLDEKSKQYLNRSINAVKRMNNLIEDLLTYSKTTSSIDSFEEVNINEVVAEIKVLHKEEFEQNKISMDVQPLPVIQGIRFQIKQLMDNLVNNAVKYKQPGRNGVIKIWAEQVNGADLNEKDIEPNLPFYKISVMDNGIGFDPMYAEKIFEIFQRLNNTYDTKGSGIGLAICKKIVQNHNGFIKADGRAGEWAKFDIYLPVNQ